MLGKIEPKAEVEARVYEHIVRLLRQLTCTSVGGTIVELGCGSKQYRKGIEGASYFGIDLRNDLYPGRGADVLADAGSLPLRDESVDLVFVVAALYLMSDTGRVLDECHRVLRQGGLLAIFDYNWWVSKRVNGVHRFSSRRLACLLRKHGFTPKIHWSCVPTRAPKPLHFFYNMEFFRILVYLVSNWVVISGRK